MDGMKAILTRRSIRIFRPEPVEAEDIRSILEAAMHAPSAGNQEPWRFVLIQDRAALQAIALDHPYASAVESCPMAVLVCAATRDLPHPDFWAVDCAAATQNLMLAAHMLGLGSVWVGLYPKRDRMAILSRLAHLPEDVEPFALVPLGYPLERPEQPDRYRPEWIRAEHWFDPWTFGRADLTAKAEQDEAERRKAAGMKRTDPGLHD
jgi:nitroreductase